MQTVTVFLLHTSPLVIYLIVSVILLLESTAIPVANTTVLLFTGALIASGRVNMVALDTAATLGSVLGGCLAYLLGTYGGRRVLLHVTRFFHVDEQKVATVERWYQRAGLGMIFFSRMIPYVRPFACLPAGISRVPFLRFLAAATAGSFLWCTSILYIGWYLGNRWELAVVLFQRYTLPTLAVVASLVAGSILITRIIKQRIHARYQSADAPAHECVQVPERDILHV